MMPMNQGKNPDKARMEPKIQASAVPHRGTMSAGGSKGTKNAMTGSSGNSQSVSNAMGKHQKTGNGGG